jgi:hypothetical protein
MGQFVLIFSSSIAIGIDARLLFLRLSLWWAY